MRQRRSDKIKSAYGTIEQDDVIVKIPRELLRDDVRVLDLCRVIIEKKEG